MSDQTPVQIAWVTRDLDATEQTLTALLGARRWVRLPGVQFSAETCSYRGRPAEFTADVSLSYAGDTQLELIAPTGGENIYTEFLDRKGPGLHHICREVADPAAFDRALSEAQDSGATVVQQGVMPGGMRFAYLSAAHAAVPYLEIAYLPEEIRSFFDYVKQEQQP